MASAVPGPLGFAEGRPRGEGGSWAGGACGPLPAPGLVFPPSAGGSGHVRSLQQGCVSFL